MKESNPISIDSIVQEVLQLSGWNEVNDLKYYKFLQNYKQIFSPGLNLPFGVTNTRVGGFIGYSAGIRSLP
jgi:aminopeptidase-like protein